MFIGPERDQGEHAEQDWRGAGDCRFGPLPPGLNTEMAANLGESDLDRPAADKPAQNVERVRIEIGAEKGLRLEFAVWVAHQYMADGNAAPGVVPHGGAGDDLDPPFAAAVPSRHQQTPPVCLRVDEARLQRGLTFPDDRRWFVERGVKPQAGDHGDPRPHVIERIDCGEAGVANADDAPVRQPKRRLDQDLSAPIGKPLVLALARRVLLPIPLRGGQDSQKRECPATPGPRNLGQQHEREPAQAARLDEVACEERTGSR